MWLVISTVLSKLKDFSRSQAATYSVHVLTSGRQCKIEMLLLQTTRLLIRSDGSSNNGNSDDPVWPSKSFAYCKLFKGHFSYNCATFDNISTDIASRGPSAIAELLISIDRLYICPACGVHCIHVNCSNCQQK